MKEVEKIINEIKGADKDALKKAQIRQDNPKIWRERVKNVKNQ